MCPIIDNNNESIIPKRMKIAMVCDFFYPRLGGVEMHIYSLASCLIQLGHKVIIITHAYSCDESRNTSLRKSKRTGVRYLPGPIKVYYCPFLPMTDQDSLPTFSATLPLIRWICIREGIDIIHAHQATSTLANESIVYAAELGLPSVYTDHSLFGFDDIASVILNRVLKTTLSTAGSVICVSHTCRQNFILRANMDPSIVYAIPNAIDSSKFTPDVSKRCQNRIKIVVVSRLVYRKGVDLLVGIIPLICKQFENVDFIIGGDGNKKLSLEEMVERERLQQRVEFLGSVPHANVRNVLNRGHIFLNCSLTESFCIAILEAASCGLFVVSTRVGGVPEVLPPDMILMSTPCVEELTQTLGEAIRVKIIGSFNDCDDEKGIMIRRRETLFDPLEFHERIKRMYSWDRVAKQTISVYSQVLNKPTITFMERLHRYKSIGSFAGYVACFIAISLHFWVMILERLQPDYLIDVVPDIDLLEIQ